MRIIRVDVFYISGMIVYCDPCKPLGTSLSGFLLVDGSATRAKLDTRGLFEYAWFDARSRWHMAASFAGEAKRKSGVGSWTAASARKRRALFNCLNRQTPENNVRKFYRSRKWEGKNDGFSINYAQAAILAYLDRIVIVDADRAIWRLRHAHRQIYH
jgi:hypothetical protein